MKSLQGLTAYEGKYNLRAKFYPQSDGSLRLVEEMCCSNYIFNPDGLECRAPRDSSAFPKQTSAEEKLNRARARAKSKLRDYILCNDFKWFVTLTLSPEQIDRNDYGAVISRLNVYLGNRVRRNGLKYVGVCEVHKRGGFHFHFLMNDSLMLSHSGTYLRPSGGKPVKEITVRKMGICLEECRDVYNIDDWSLGFTTAIELYGDRQAVANYVGKYITKGEKVGGRWYYSGGALNKPVYKYDRVDFDSFDCDYAFECPNGEILVRTFC